MTKDFNTSSERVCPVCDSKQLKVFFEMSDVPVACNILWPTEEAARNCLKGDIKLAFCPVCNLITNLAFEPSRLEYTEAYENPLHFSPRFQKYSQSIAASLVKQYNLHNKKIIEIGCGKGYFLNLLCELGGNRGVGFDPTHVAQKKHDNRKNQVKFIQDFYSERYQNYQGDLIVCRHTLEHIQNPKGFLNMIRRSIGNRANTHLFFEVPNGLNIFRKLFIWDIIYEHCSYFTPTSLRLTLSACGFHVSKLTEEYKGQFICIHALPNNQNMDTDILDREKKREIDQISSDITFFASKYRRKVQKCRHKLEQIEDKGQRSVIWGAGSKGATFLNTLKNLNIEYAVDINPRKQGMYVPGTGQRIVPPTFLRDYKPDVIIIMNPIYTNEIEEFTNKLRLTTKFMYV